MPFIFSIGETNEVAFAIDLSIKVGLLFSVAAVSAICLRRHSAAARHRVWCLAFCGALSIPVLWAIIPKQGIPILPSDSSSSIASPTDPVISSTHHGKSRPAALDQDRASFTADALREPLSPKETTINLPLAADDMRITPETRQGSSVQVTSAVDNRWNGVHWLAAVWGVGCLMSLVPLIVGVVRSRLLLRGARLSSEGNLLQELCGKLGLWRTVRLYESNTEVVPMTWGVFRPLILLPASHQEWSPERRRIVLLHELAHVQRFDLPLQILARMACAAYWFNPLLWYGLSRMRLECERACDDCVVCGGEQAFDYATVLVDIAESFRPPRMIEAVSMARTSELEVRVRSLLDSARSHLPLSRSWTYGSFVAATLFLLAIVALHPVPRSVIAEELQEAKNDPTEPEKSIVVERPTVDALGDPLPEGALLRLGTQRFEHPSNVSELALSPDEKTIVATGEGSLLIAWDTQTGKERWRANTRELGFNPTAAAYGCRALVFAPDGREFYTPGKRNEFIVWDTLTGEHKTIAIKPSFPKLFGRIGGTAASSIDITADGEQFVCGYSGGLAICDPEGQVKYRIANIPEKPIKSADMNRDRLNFGGDYTYGRFSPDGKILAVVANEAPQEIRLCNSEDGKEIRRIPLTHNLVRLAFSPDGKQIVATERDSAVRMYSVETGKELWAHKIELKNKAESYTCGVAYSPDGQTIAACAPIGSDFWIYLFQPQTGEVLGKLQGHQWKPWAVAFTADSKLLYSSGWDGTIRRWDVEAQKQLPPPSGIRATAVVTASPDGSKLAYQDDLGAVRLVDAKLGEELSTYELPGAKFSQLMFSPDSKLLAGGGASGENVFVAIWDLDSGEVVHRWEWLKGGDPHSNIEELCFTQDGRFLAAASFRQDTAYLWDLASGEQVAELKHLEVYGLSFSPDGKTLATAGWDKKLRFWETSTGTLEREFEIKPEKDPDQRLGLLGDDTRLYTVRYAPQGGLLATAHIGGVVRIWDAESLTLLNAFSVQELFRYGVMNFSPDGLWLATGSENRDGHFARLWDPQTGEIVWDTGRHQGNLYTVGFGRDNKTLVSGAEDGTCYLWDLRPPEKLLEASLPESWTAISSDDSKTAYRAMWGLAEMPKASVAMLGEKLRAINKVVNLQLINPELSKEESDRRSRMRKLLVDKEPQTESLLTIRRAVSVLQQINTPDSRKLLEDMSANHPNEDVKRVASAALER